MLIMANERYAYKSAQVTVSTRHALTCTLKHQVHLQVLPVAVRVSDAMFFRKPVIIGGMAFDASLMVVLKPWAYNERRLLQQPCSHAEMSNANQTGIWKLCYTADADYDRDLRVRKNHYGITTGKMIVKDRTDYNKIIWITWNVTTLLHRVNVSPCEETQERADI